MKWQSKVEHKNSRTRLRNRSLISDFQNSVGSSTLWKRCRRRHRCCHDGHEAGGMMLPGHLGVGAKEEEDDDDEESC